MSLLNKMQDGRRLCYRSVAIAPGGTVSATPLWKQEGSMPRGDKSKYTDKEKRQAEHIEEGYEARGVPEDEAERRAWATVNKVHGGGEKPGGGGYGKSENHEPMRKGGRNSHKKS
jgi:plasmid stabilization system protein ParE